MSIVIGITGGISCGKTNVCNEILRLGYKIFDCDKIYDELVKINAPIYQNILKFFGREYLLENEEIDRKKLGRLIFSNEEKRILLNSITHPLIIEELKKQIAKCNDEIVFVEVPLLYESGFDSICDGVICIYLHKEEQIKRLMLRDNIDRPYAIKKIDSQMDLEIKKELADYVIDTKGSFEETKMQVLSVINEIKRSF